MAAGMAGLANKLANAGIVWAGHSNPRHVRNKYVPKFGRKHGLPEKQLLNIDVREGDEARATEFARSLGIADVGIDRCYCVTMSIASAIPTKIIFVDDLIAAKPQIIDLPAEICVIDTAGNDLTKLTSRDDVATLELADKVYTFLTELLSKFSLIIINATISCRTGFLKGCSPEIYYFNAEKYNHFLQTLVEGRQFDPQGRIQFNKLPRYRYLEATSNDPMCPKAPADASIMLKDNIHPHEDTYVNRVRAFLFDNLYLCVEGAAKTTRKRPNRRAKKSAKIRALLGVD